jgi:hypothetical protein
VDSHRPSLIPHIFKLDLDRDQQAQIQYSSLDASGCLPWVGKHCQLCLWFNLVSLSNIGSPSFVNAFCLLHCHDYHGFYSFDRHMKRGSGLFVT